MSFGGRGQSFVTCFLGSRVCGGVTGESKVETSYPLGAFVRNDESACVIVHHNQSYRKPKHQGTHFNESVVSIRKSCIVIMAVSVSQLKWLTIWN